MATISDAQISAARQRGADWQKAQPCVQSARYDAQSDRVVLEMANECLFSFPPRLAQGLEGATADQLQDVELLAGGYGLRWEALDVDLSVPGLLSGMLGTQAYMAALAGRTTSRAKSEASRRNGLKGGRPRVTLPEQPSEQEAAHTASKDERRPGDVAKHHAKVTELREAAETASISVTARIREEVTIRKDTEDRAKIVYDRARRED